MEFACIHPQLYIKTKPNSPPLLSLHPLLPSVIWLKHPFSCTLWSVLGSVTNPQQCTVPATMKKINPTPVKTSTPVMRLSPTHVLHCQLHWQHTRQEVKQVSFSVPEKHWETGAGPSSRETNSHLKPSAVITGMLGVTHLQTTGSLPAQVGCSLTLSVYTFWVP